MISNYFSFFCILILIFISISVLFSSSFLLNEIVKCSTLLFNSSFHIDIVSFDFIIDGSTLLLPVALFLFFFLETGRKCLSSSFLNKVDI